MGFYHGTNVGACLFSEGTRSQVPLHSYNGAFTLDVKSVLNDNLGGILGGTQCSWPIA